MIEGLRFNIGILAYNVIVLAHVGSTQDLDIPSHIPEPIVNSDDFKLIEAVVNSQTLGNMHQSAKRSQYNNGVIILLHGMQHSYLSLTLS